MLSEVEQELRAQIQRALDFGIDVTHLDSHMGTLFYTADYLKIYRKLGKEFKLPVMWNGDDLAMFGLAAKNELKSTDFTVDKIYQASPKNFKEGMADYYADVLTNLKPGLSIILIHTAYDDAEMQAVTIDHPLWGAAWRQKDLDFFTSDECKKILEKEHIKLVTWREIRDKIIRK